MNIGTLFAQQQNFFNTNRTKDVGFRLEQLKKLKKVLEENEAMLYRAIDEDFGKSEFETYMSEFSLIYHELNLFIRKLKKWSKRKKVPTGLANFPAKSYIIPEPLGITLVIGAWNYPYQLSLLPALTSLAAGNTVILKPSELPAKTSEAMAQMINGNFPNDYFCVVEGGVNETNQLLEHRFDKIFFTGSIPVGKIIYQAAAKHLTPVTLELGGKSPTFVLADSNIKMAARRIVWAKFLNAGQTCVAPDYILAEKSIENELVEALKSEIEKNYSRADESGNYVKIINDKNFDRLEQLIHHDKVFHGAQTHKPDRFIAPTLLKDVSFEDEIMKDEIFGPILPIVPFTQLEQAIQKVKEMPKPLSCYIYSNNRKTIHKLLKEISFGGGAINESLMHLSNSKLPFGGVGFSGIGNYHDKAGFDAFTHFKSVLDKPTWFESNIKYAPYSEKKLKMIKRLLK